MKKRITLLFLFIILLLLMAYPIKADITGEMITGRQASQSTNVSIFINPNIPTLTIISPKNETYLKNYSILLDFISDLADNLWYNLDSSENISISSAIYFNTSEGSHTLYLFANNSCGITMKNVTFAVNSTLFIILYEEYKGSTKGNSTEFINYTYEEIQALRDVILENINFGKILFNQAINLTDDANPSDNILDLDSYTNISFNRLELDPANLPNFNVSAGIWLYNLNFTTPRILRNGVTCPESICTNKIYSNGILSFNVTSIAIYSAEETLPEIPIISIGAGGGAGARARMEITFNKEKIMVKLKPGEKKQEELIIGNLGNVKVKISLQNLFKDFLSLDEIEFELRAGEFKTIFLNFKAEEYFVPDVYLGSLIVVIDKTEKEIPILLELESKEILFEVTAEIQKGDLQIFPGEMLNVKITVNSTDPRIKDVNLAYLIKDAKGNLIFSQKENISISEKIVFTKSFKIPDNAEKGTHVFYVKASYEDKISFASVLFYIKEIPFPTEIVILIFAIIILITLLIIILIITLAVILKSRKKAKMRVKIAEKLKQGVGFKQAFEPIIKKSPLKYIFWNW